MLCVYSELAAAARELEFRREYFFNTKTRTDSPTNHIYTQESHYPRNKSLRKFISRLQVSVNGSLYTIINEKNEGIRNEIHATRHSREEKIALTPRQTSKILSIYKHIYLSYAHRICRASSPAVITNK